MSYVSAEITALRVVKIGFSAVSMTPLKPKIKSIISTTILFRVRMGYPGNSFAGYSFKKSKMASWISEGSYKFQWCQCPTLKRFQLGLMTTLHSNIVCWFSRQLQDHMQNSIRPWMRPLCQVDITINVPLFLEVRAISTSKKLRPPQKTPRNGWLCIFPN
jgi:hypothetical protein